MHLCVYATENEIFKECFEGESTSFYGSMLGTLLPEGMEQGAGSSAENEVREHCIHFGSEWI